MLWGPLLSGREIAYDGLEPDVDALPLVSLQRHGYTPFDIPGYSPVAQAALQKADGEVTHVGFPVGLGAHPLQQRLLKGAQLQEEVLRLPDDGRVSADFADHVDEVLGIEGAAAVVALVAAGSFRTAVGTGALHVAIGQESAVRLAIGLQHGVLVDVALLVQGQKDVLGDLGVILGVGGGEQVKTDAQPLPVVLELGLILAGDLLRRGSSLLRCQGHRRAVSVAARHHEDLVAPHAVVASEDIGRQESARHLAQVQ